MPIGFEVMSHNPTLECSLGCVAADISHAQERRNKRDNSYYWSKGYIRRIGIVSDRRRGRCQTRACQTRRCSRVKLSVQKCALACVPRTEVKLKSRQ